MERRSFHLDLGVASAPTARLHAKFAPFWVSSAPFDCLEMGRSAIALLSALLALAAARASGLPSQSRRLAAWGTPGAKPKRE